MLYATVLDELFAGWLDVVLGCALAGQWGVPAALYLDATVGGVSSPFGFLALVCAALLALVAVAVAVNYARRCWPAGSVDLRGDPEGE